MKRLFDVAASAVGLIVLSPVFLISCVAVAVGSPGPVIFRQQRVGRFFRPFTLYKFRTMQVGAERGPAVTAGGDARITGIGRLLRKTKLDELPQLFNVLKGDMSLVGPRPEVAKYVELFREDYREILTVRPGITDYAAIEYRNEEEILKEYADPEAGYLQVVLPAKIALYRQYLSRRGFWVDLGIILQTLRRIVADRR